MKPSKICQFPPVLHICWSMFGVQILTMIAMYEFALSAKPKKCVFVFGIFVRICCFHTQRIVVCFISAEKMLLSNWNENIILIILFSKLVVTLRIECFLSCVYLLWWAAFVTTFHLYFTECFDLSQTQFLVWDIKKSKGSWSRREIESERTEIVIAFISGAHCDVRLEQSEKPCAYQPAGTAH